MMRQGDASHTRTPRGSQRPLGRPAGDRRWTDRPEPPWITRDLLYAILGVRGGRRAARRPEAGNPPGAAPGEHSNAWVPIPKGLLGAPGSKEPGVTQAGT